MKLTVNKDQLNEGLAALQSVVCTRSSLPVLSNVLLVATDKGLQLTATDMDVYINNHVLADIKSRGAITLPAKRLLDIGRAAPDKELEIQVNERNQCFIRSRAAKFRLFGLPAEDFPPLPPIEGARSFVLPQGKLKLMIRRTSYAASTDNTRYVLNGLLLSVKGHQVTAVATDGRRLALAEEEADVDEAFHAEFIVPSKAVAELGRFLQEEGQIEVRLSVALAQFIFHSPKQEAAGVLTTKLVEGTYPNYQQVIPRECRESISLPREEFLQALRRAIIMTSEESGAVKLTFTRNQLVITSSTPDIGDFQDEVLTNYKGPDLAIAFNPHYLVEVLEALDTEEVIFEVTDELSPCVLKINGPFLYVTMPMRTN